MIGYKDMTFCPFNGDCKNADGCFRALTDEVKAGAKKWWGGDDYPIVTFASKPQCWEKNIVKEVK